MTSFPSKIEVKKLIACCQKFNLGKGIILSFDNKDKFKIEGIEIEIIPAWQYFFSDRKTF